MYKKLFRIVNFFKKKNYSNEGILNFFTNSNLIKDFMQDENFSSDYAYESSLGMNINTEGEPLFQRTPFNQTSVYTPGYTTKARYSVKGKYIPSKVRPGKSDIRSGK